MWEGPIANWIGACDRMLEMDLETIVPGHGPVTDREGLRGFQRFMRQLAAVGAQAARTGASLDETRAAASLDTDAGYEVMAIPFVMRLDRDFVIRRAWEEATGRFEPIPLP